MPASNALTVFQFTGSSLGVVLVDWLGDVANCGRCGRYAVVTLDGGLDGCVVRAKPPAAWIAAAAPADRG